MYVYVYVCIYIYVYIYMYIYTHTHNIYIYMADAEARLTESAPVGLAAGVCAVVACGALVLARSGSFKRPAVRCRDSISSYSSRSSPERERERLDQLIFFQILA
jgi:hypothetical protein